MTRLESETRTALEMAIVQWAEREYLYQGESFATSQEMKSIKSDPLGFAEMLKGADAYEFFRLVIEASRREDPRY